MAAHATDWAASGPQSIPLLEAGFLPSAEDWALLESIQTSLGRIDGFDHEPDRDGGFHLSTAFDD
jgi:hypothetical protein